MEEIFKSELEKLNIKIDEEQLEEFFTYMKKILEWNEKVNLTAITDEKEFIIKHFVDSLTVNKYVEKYDSIIDIGTGAGFPGIPLKIVNKNKKITLIDSVGKKLKVIEAINEELNLPNLEIIHTRAEDLASKDDYREKYDVAITRAVSNMSTIMEYMLPFVKIGGIAICMKGPDYKEELKNATNAIKILGGEILEISEISIGKELRRNLIIIKKNNKSPLFFPRKQGKPLKDPIR